jgi:hypothetical protein
MFLSLIEIKEMFGMENKTLHCPFREKINEYCSCPKVDCERHGLCCECIVNHKNRINDPFEKRFPHCLRDLLKEALADEK